MLRIVDRACYTICIVCIISGVCLGLAMVWGALDDSLGWKPLVTVLVLLLGSSLTLSVNRLLGRGRRSDNA